MPALLNQPSCVFVLHGLMNINPDLRPRDILAGNEPISQLWEEEKHRLESALVMLVPRGVYILDDGLSNGFLCIFIPKLGKDVHPF